MAANFWKSSHCNRWLLDAAADPTVLAGRRDHTQFSRAQVNRIGNFLYHVMQQAASLLMLRQRVTATAIVYFRRFFVSHSFADFDPALVATTCLYLASKVEECSVRVRHVMEAMRRSFPDYCYAKTRPYTPRLLFQCEFVVLDALNFDLIVFHPYRPLQQYAADASVPDSVLRFAWAVVNDSYCTDVHLTHPPFVIALAALSLAAIKEGYDIQHWFAALNVNPVEVGEARAAIAHFYATQAELIPDIVGEPARREAAGGEQHAAPNATPDADEVDEEVEVAQLLGGSTNDRDDGSLIELLRRVDQLVPPCELPDVASGVQRGESGSA